MTSTSLPLVVLSFGVATIAGVIYFVMLERRLRSSSNMMSERSGPVHYNNLPRFWTVPRILEVIFGFALIVLGFGYFWNTPGIMREADLLAGYVSVMIGVVMISIALLTGTMARVRAMNKSENSRSQNG